MRSFADMTGEMGGPGGVAIGAGAQQPPGPGMNNNAQPQVGTRPLGWRTGAPPRTVLTSIPIIPAGFGAATQIVLATAESRLVTLTAPLVGFSIYVGDSGVKITDMALTPGIPYAIPIVGNQELWAITDAPVYIPLRIQIAPLLNGDRERIY